MPSFLIKRSMSPDGKIDATSVEVTIEAELTDTQTVIDAIALTDNFANYVREQTPAPRVFATSNVGQVTSNGGQTEGTVSGVPAAVYDGEPGKSGKRGPGAVIISGEKFKSFDTKHIQAAKDAKANGKPLTVVFKRNEQWKSNDIVSVS